MTTEQHQDVASYALGVLDAHDTERFEEHLATCWTCAAELESMLPVVDLLAEVDGRDVVTAERSTTDGALLGRMLATVSEDRRRAQSRKMFSLAAGIVLLALLTGLTLFVGTRVAGPEVTAQPPGTSTDPSPAGPWASGGPGIGGPDVPSGERFSATDAATGVRADLIVESKPFGTEISFALTQVTGPRTCRLVLLRDAGAAEVVSTWTVPVNGYGTAKQRQPLLLQAATAIIRGDIDKIQVQSIAPNGVATPLVTVPV